ncbi:hypothetical protein [Ignavigranum ruoffiae]|uniref:hypothetical protein n=1 Tax=Ignavigranum ruoffiae TaxID=89093 RepID=UPI0024ACE376|nr:hypothetical protein [Ignavigranum ruoffiae]
MEQLRNKLSTMPQKFWIYNYAMSLVYFLLGNHWAVLPLILFPVAVILISSLAKSYRMDTHYQSLIGFYPFEKGNLLSFGLALLLNFIIWQVAHWLVLIALVLLYTQDTNH